MLTLLRRRIGVAIDPTRNLMVVYEDNLFLGMCHSLPNIVWKDQNAHDSDIGRQ